jgi:predicted ABC-type ATPase
LNADVIARSINPNHPEAASLAAGRQTLAELARAIRERETFAYETTLSSKHSIDLMREAREAGYEVGLVFVALNSADLNVERVAERVARGGHDIPEIVIRRRYVASLRRLPEAIGIAAGTMLFDNSHSTGPQLLVQIQAGSIEMNNLDEADLFHCRLAEAVAEALSVSTDAVFRAAKLD